MSTDSANILESLKRTMSTIVNTSSPQDNVQHDSGSSNDNSSYIAKLKQQKELEILQQKLADKQRELEQKEEFLNARNQHILEKAKSRKVDLDGDGVDDIEIQLDDKGKDRTDIAPTLINSKYVGSIPQPLPEHKNEVSKLLTDAIQYLDGTKVSLDNIASVTSRLMVSARDFSDLNGNTKKSVVLTALGNIAITSAGTTESVKQNVDFVQRTAGNLIDIMCAANKGAVQYVDKPQQQQQRTREEIEACTRDEKPLPDRQRPFCCSANTSL